jgi:hypothetical protein
MLWFDEYETQARAVPGLLALLPIAVAGTVVGLRDDPIVSAVFAIVVAAGGPLLMAGFVRRRGLGLQAELVARWGGLRTTDLLRCRTGPTNAALRDQRRRELERVSNLELATVKAEQADPQAADDLIETGIAVLRERTRGKDRFPLVFAENKNYGFERNLLAMRWIGVLSSVIGGAALLTVIGLGIAGVVHHTLLELVLGLAVDLGLLAAWLWYPTEQRVRDAAVKYAGTLLDAAVNV